jgi:hypothetical protein
MVWRNGRGRDWIVGHEPHTSASGLARAGEREHLPENTRKCGRDGGGAA